MVVAGRCDDGPHAALVEAGGRGHSAGAFSYSTGQTAINRKPGIRRWSSARAGYPKAACATDTQNAMVSAAPAVAIVIWLEASAWPVPKCVAIR